MPDTEDVIASRPSPETKKAWLPSVAFDYPTATMHKFVEARACVLQGAGGGPAYEFIFQCCETGFERRWGVVDRLTPHEVDLGPGLREGTN